MSASLTPEERRQLLVAVRYEERYHRPLWAGRERTDDETLGRLADRGLLYRKRGEHGTRWWYFLTPSGRQALGA